MLEGKLSVLQVVELQCKLPWWRHLDGFGRFPNLMLALPFHAGYLGSKVHNEVEWGENFEVYHNRIPSFPYHTTSEYDHLSLVRVWELRLYLAQLEGGVIPTLVG
ncbi:hypothetical protein QYF36_012453 [Acer negundo]|nr:hypothetical protein QYF36_012453 [Acer negundo]